MKLYLKENVYFVKGAKNAAIYDTNKNKVYSIDEYGKDIIENIISGKKIKTEIEREFIKKLISLELLTVTNKCSSDEKIRRPIAKLIYAWLEITPTCNLRCIHCYGQFGYPKINKNDILKTQDWKNIIDKLIQYGCRDIQIIGGEPMMHNDFYDILKYAHLRGMRKIDVFTNATLINEDTIEVLKSTNANVRVSVYGHNAKVHDNITQKKGSFEANKRGLELLKKNSIPTSIAVVVMKENEKYIKEIKQYITDLGHKYNGYDVIRPSCITDKKEHSITNVELLYSRYNTKAEFWTNKNAFLKNHFYNSCWNGKIAITSKGEILPCIFARDEILGNIKEDTEEMIINKIINKWEITKDSVEFCKDCEYRYCCHDCRPLAKAINGSINKKYPRCCYNPYNGTWENIQEYTKELAKV